MNRIVLATLILIVLGAPNGSAQRPSPTPPPGPVLQSTQKPDDVDVVKITTNLVQVDAVVTDKNGKVVASRLFEESEKLDHIAPPEAVVAFSEAFGRIANDMIAWTVRAP